MTHGYKELLYKSSFVLLGSLSISQTSVSPSFISSFTMPVTELVFSDLKQDASLVEEREKALPEAFQWFTTIESAVSAHTGLILHHNNTDVSNARNRCIAIGMPPLSCTG